MVYTPNRAGLAELLRSDGIKAMIAGKTAKVLAEAIATAPFDPDNKTGTHFKDSIDMEVVVEPTLIGRGGDIPRVIGRVTAHDPQASHIEMGTGPSGSRTPRHRTLGKALGAARS